MWFICDDDLMHPRGLSQVLDVLERYPDTDYIFANVAPRPTSDRQQIMDLLTKGTAPPAFPTKCRDRTSRPIKNFETFIDQSFDDALLGSVMCHVFRLSRWRLCHLEIPAHSNDMFNLAMIYPHCIILANTMADARCFYLAEPCMFTFWGGQEWMGMVPYIITVHFQDLLDHYQLCGMSVKQISKCRRRLLLNSAPALRALLFDRTIPGRERFVLRRFISRNLQHPIALLTLPLLIAAHSSILLVRKLAKSMRRR